VVPACIVGAPRVLFLGAGASKPLGKMLMGEFVQSLLNQRSPAPELLKCICDKNRDLEFLLEVLEHLASMTYLREYFQHTGVPAVRPRGQPNVEPVLEFTRDAEILIKWVKREVFKHYRELVLPVWYQNAFGNLAQSLVPPDWPLVVFTTNYDPMVEEFCRLAHWPLCAGFAHDEPSGEYYWSRRAYEEFSIDQKEKTIVLVKLHGSTTWVRQGGRILKSPAVYTGDDAMCENVMIFPATKKVAIEDPYFSGYDYLEKCLGAAQLCLVVGYSFRDYDALMRFKSAQLSNRALAIRLIDPMAQIRIEELHKSGINAEPLSVSSFLTPECLQAVQNLADAYK